MHGGDGTPLSVRVLWPGAEKVAVIDRATGEAVADAGETASRRLLRRPDRRTARRHFPTGCRLSAGTAEWEAEDPYRFPPILGSLDVHLLAEGSHRRMFERLGAHPTTMEGIDGVAFAVWAPNAQRVSVVGDFNHWDGRRHPMRKRIEVGGWEIFIPGVGARHPLQVRDPRRGWRPADAEGRSGRLPARAPAGDGIDRGRTSDSANGATRRGWTRASAGTR